MGFRKDLKQKDTVYLKELTRSRNKGTSESRLLKAFTTRNQFEFAQKYFTEEWEKNGDFSEISCSIRLNKLNSKQDKHRIIKDTVSIFRQSFTRDEYLAEKASRK